MIFLLHCLYIIPFACLLFSLSLLWLLLAECLTCWERASRLAVQACSYNVVSCIIISFWYILSYVYVDFELNCIIS